MYTYFFFYIIYIKLYTNSKYTKIKTFINKTIFHSLRTCFSMTIQKCHPKCHRFGAKKKLRNGLKTTVYNCFFYSNVNILVCSKRLHVQLRSGSDICISPLLPIQPRKNLKTLKNLEEATIEIWRKIVFIILSIKYHYK